MLTINVKEPYNFCILHNQHMMDDSKGTTIFHDLEKKHHNIYQFCTSPWRIDASTSFHDEQQKQSLQQSSRNQLIFIKKLISIIPEGILSQMLPALCGTAQIHLCGNTCNFHMHPSPLCTSGEGLSACIPNYIKIIYSHNCPFMGLQHIKHKI